MKKLDRYIMKEMLVPCLIGTVAVVLMFQANTLIYLGKTYNLPTIPLLALAQIIVFKTPDFLRQTLPIGMALASSLAIARLTRESELTAMRAAGMPIRRIMIPVGMFGLIVGVLNFWITEGVMPTSEKKFAELGQKIFITGSTPDYTRNITLKLPKSNTTAYFASVRSEGDRMRIEDALVFMWQRPGEATVAFSHEGIFEKGIITFNKADMWQFKDGKVVGFRSKRMVIDETVSLNDLYTTEQPSGKSMGELRTLMTSQKALGHDVTSLEIDYYSRFSVPASCIVFAIAGPVFAVMLGKNGGFIGVFLSCVMVMIYFNMYVISTQIIGRNGWVSPFVAAWLPNFIFLAFGLIGLRRLE